MNYETIFEKLKAIKQIALFESIKAPTINKELKEQVKIEEDN